MPTIKAAIFDIYRTLLDIRIDEERIDAYAFISNWLSYKGVNITAERLKQAYQQTAREEIKWSREKYPDIDVGIVFKKIINSQKHNSDKTGALIEEISLLFRQLTTLSVKNYAGVNSMLKSVSKKKRLAIISNAQRLYTMPELKKFDIEKYFETIIFSSDVKASKPNPKIFKAMLKSLKIEPDEAVYIGDNLFDDVWGAQKAGMKTVWLNRGDPNTFPKELERPTPSVELNGNYYKELPDILLSIT